MKMNFAIKTICFLVLVLLLPGCKKPKEEYYHAVFTGANNSAAEFYCDINRIKNTIYFSGGQKNDPHVLVNGNLVINNDKISGTISYKYNGLGSGSEHTYTVSGNCKRKEMTGRYTSEDIYWSANNIGAPSSDSGTFQIKWISRKEPH